jgi:hypothetical protein
MAAVAVHEVRPAVAFEVGTARVRVLCGARAVTVSLVTLPPALPGPTLPAMRRLVEALFVGAGAVTAFWWLVP